MAFSVVKLQSLSAHFQTWPLRTALEKLSYLGADTGEGPKLPIKPCEQRLMLKLLVLAVPMQERFPGLCHNLKMW